MTRRHSVPVLVFAIFCLLLAAASAQAQNSPNFRALKGTEASEFVLPGDVQLVRSFHLDAYNLTYERYQQYYGDAKVLGGQLTLYWNDAGELVSVIGAHHPNIQPKNAVSLSKADAERIARGDIGQDGRRIVDLMIDPATGRHFYRVETRRLTSRWIHWVGAQSGRVIKKFDSLMNDCEEVVGEVVTPVQAPCGHGAHYDNGATTDVKDLTWPNSQGSLTKSNGSNFSLDTGTHITHDQGSTNRPFTGPVATDSDDEWKLTGRTSPAQGALVDAHYYAGVAHRYFADRFNNYNNHHDSDFVWPAGALPMNIQAHFFKDYVNAFWNGDILAFGDGDGVSYNELTSLDVVGHEMTHAVTEFTSNLIYSGESGALNEAFSDMMGNSMEFYADTLGLEPSSNLGPDWLVGEDFDRRSSEPADGKGFRNMAYPEEDGDPSHYSARYTGTSDNGGVHINSGIPNHAYYLLVNGEADCQNTHAHCSDNTTLNPLDWNTAADIFFLGFTALNEDANMCDARAATVAVAGGNVSDVQAAWDAVGVDTELCGGPANDLPKAEFTASSTSVDINDTITFTSSSTDTEDDEAGLALIHSWNFGDGTPSLDGSNLLDKGAVVTHSYTAGGTFEVVLTVTDSNGDTGTAKVSISVHDPNEVNQCLPDKLIKGESCDLDCQCASFTCRGKPGSKTCK